MPERGIINEWRVNAASDGAGSAMSVNRSAQTGRLHIVTHLIVAINGAPTANARVLFNDGIGVPTPFAYVPTNTVPQIYDFGYGWPATAENVAIGFSTDTLGGTVIGFMTMLGYDVGGQ